MRNGSNRCRPPTAAMHDTALDSNDNSSKMRIKKAPWGRDGSTDPVPHSTLVTSLDPSSRTSRPPLRRRPLLNRPRVLGEHPPPRPPRRPLLPLLHALHPAIAALEPGPPHVLPAQRDAGRRVRGAQLDAVAPLAPQGDVAGEHVQVPKGERGREGGLAAQRDRGREVEEAEVGGIGFVGVGAVVGGGADADADEFDFGDEEAVARVAVAHQAVQVGEAGEVESLFAVLFLPHARVPDFVRFDEADDAAATEGPGFVVGVCGYEKGTVFSVALREHGDVMLMALAGLERRVDFGSVEGGNGVLKCALIGGLDDGLIVVDAWESRGWDGNVQKAEAFLAVREIGNSHDGVEVEVFPIFQISDVPPAVHMVAKTCGDLPHQCHCWVWSRQVLHNSGCRPIEAELGSEITISG